MKNLVIYFILALTTFSCTTEKLENQSDFIGVFSSTATTTFNRKPQLEYLIVSLDKGVYTLEYTTDYTIYSSGKSRYNTGKLDDTKNALIVNHLGSEYLVTYNETTEELIAPYLRSGKLKRTNRLPTIQELQDKYYAILH